MLNESSTLEAAVVVVAWAFVVHYIQIPSSWIAAVVVAPRDKAGSIAAAAAAAALMEACLQPVASLPVFRASLPSWNPS